MNILNICEILPLDNLKRENDISIKIQEEINKIEPSIKFTFLKSIPYTNLILSKVKPLWKNYYEYIQKEEININGYKTIIFPWYRLPTSNFNIDKRLLFINKLLMIKNVEKMLNNQINSFDLILSQNNIADGYIANYLSNKYNIPHIHTFRGQINDQIYNSTFIKKILNNSKLCITPSPTIKNYFKKKDINLELTPHGIDNIFFTTENKNYSKAKFITVARLLKLKNINLVIESLSKLHEKGLDFEYVIIGDGPEKNNLIHLCKRLNIIDKIKFLGWLDKNEIVKNLKIHNIMIMPSKPETLGRVYLEAAASNCLCIGHYGSGVDGFFTDRIDALFCDRHDIESKLEHIIKNINNEEIQKIILKAREKVDKLKWSEVSEKYIKLFNKAIK